MQEKRIEVIIYYYGSKLVAAVRRGGGVGGPKGRSFGAAYAIIAFSKSGLTLF